MSVSGTTNADFTLAQLRQASQARKPAGTDSFQSSLTLRIAEIRSQTFGTLLATASGGDEKEGASAFDALLNTTDNTGGTGAIDPATGLSASGRNTSLFDPESAYKMMTTINSKDVTYKAEYVEMKDMESYLDALQQEGQKLKDVDAASSSGDIKARLQAFADAYNGWIDRFDEELAPGGLLADTQAAQVSQWELEQSVENMFTGVTAGLHGMRDLGLNIDPVTNFASVDSAKLDAVLASNKEGAVATMQEFGANFAKSAELLNADGNFIPNRLNNLSRVIEYIDDNKSSLQAEFGLGDTAKPTGVVANALAVYNAMYGTATS